MLSAMKVLGFGWAMWICLAQPAAAATLEETLRGEGAANLARAARQSGDAARGAVVFYQPQLACTRCHLTDQADHRLGPDLTRFDAKVSDEYLVEAVLDPSKVIRKGFETVSVFTTGGKVISGIVETDDDRQVVLRDAAQDFKRIEIARDAIDEIEPAALSLMPAGQVNVLTSRQQFLDLVRYLIEIRDGGAPRARELEPAPFLYAARPLPEYEKQIDHAGILSDLDDNALQRGQKIYNRLCVNCHGTHNRPGSLPTSLKFASGKFKNGNDPHTMYRTLTHGFGMMAPQTWMVPTQKYDVIHYVREAYLKKHNPSQYFAVDQAYLDQLPEGNTRGPAPAKYEPWEQMDYGPNLVLTLEIGDNATNFAYKGNAVRLDTGPGGVARGRYWMVFDYDTMRVAAAWSGEGFIDWRGINFDSRHGIHPRTVGTVHAENLTGPGWGRPTDGSFQDVRLVGRDGRKYGPLPRDWAHYQGMYYHGAKTIIRYTVGKTDVLEMPGVLLSTPQPVFTRTLNIGPRDRDLVMQVAHVDGASGQPVPLGKSVVFGRVPEARPPSAATQSPSTDLSRFDGTSRLEVKQTVGLHLQRTDFTLTARIKTKYNGSLVALTSASDSWVPNGMTWFIRDGRLAFDIGWVGVHQGRQRVADGKWHDVALAYQQETGKFQFFVDGQPDGPAARLLPRAVLKNPVIRIGSTADNFPKPSGLRGQISEVRCYNKLLDSKHIAELPSKNDAAAGSLVAHWDLTAASDGVVRNLAGGEQAAVRQGADNVESPDMAADGLIIAGTRGDDAGVTWQNDGANLRLKIPRGEKPRRFTLWFASAGQREQAEQLTRAVVIDRPKQNLAPLLEGGPPRWPDVLTTQALIGKDNGPFAIDVLTLPVENPWFCRLRISGFDFTPDGKQAVVSAWDGSVWLVSGLDQLPENGSAADAGTVPLTWRRIASGLFQPLGVKIFKGKIFVTCRDQLCILHDYNGDDEIDYIENFNNDHQVTAHFHEFAMGLQADDEGNFYYAKSARHALKAVVPHHGTLLRVSKDGTRTDILATGFRAANGVCLNPDGTFIVTDQEGHWNPKNRINYVHQGGFYGNMFGYHDVTDSSDDAMQQPLCWITNAFDRSPAELLWVDSKRWGPLDGQLLNLSYGYGMVYVVPHEKIDGQPQGGMCELPIPRLPTGVMRGRFHPTDGQLYLCGMFAWAGSQTSPGGFYRLRYTGQPVHLPVGLQATQQGMTLKFSGSLDRKSAGDVKNYQVKVWDLKRTAHYGSDHHNERPLQVAAARLDDDGRTVRLEIPDIQPTWCMEITYQLRSSEGKNINGKIHNTIHALSPTER